MHHHVEAAIAIVTIPVACDTGHTDERSASWPLVALLALLATPGPFFYSSRAGMFVAAF